MERRLNTAIQEKRTKIGSHGVLLLHDNVRSHIANMTKEANLKRKAGRCCCTLPIWHQQIFNSFDLLLMLCAEFRIDAELRAWLISTNEVLKILLNVMKL